MTAIRHELRARCASGKVWEVLADLEAVQHYNPTVKSVAVQGSQRTGVGATRRCQLVPNGEVLERVTHWEEGRALGLEVAKSDWPITFMRWVTRIEPDGPTTRITQDLEYEMKFGPLGWLLNQLVMKRKLTATLDEVLTKLALRAEEAP